MSHPTLVNNLTELRANTLQFAQDVSALAAVPSPIREAIGNGCSHAVEWVAFQNDAGKWKVSFSKYAGYNDLTFKIYDKLRKVSLTGTDTKRRVEKLGGVSVSVSQNAGGTNHPAVDAVKATCEFFGKVPKSTARVRIFTASERPAAMDVLVAAIRAASLTDDELTRLFAEAKAPV